MVYFKQCWFTSEQFPNATEIVCNHDLLQLPDCQTGAVWARCQSGYCNIPNSSPV